MHPGGWFDVGGGSYLQCLFADDSLLIPKPDFQQWGYFWMNGLDTIYVQFSHIGETHFVAFGGPGCAPVGVEKVIPDDEVYIGPIPAVDVLRIRAREQMRSIEIYDLQGRTMLKLPNPNQKDVQFSISALAPQIYFLQIEMENGRVIRKLITVNAE